MKRVLVFASLAATLGFTFAQCASTGAAKVDASPEVQRAGLEAFATVVTVLQHPRCMNCHPAGRAPLQGEDSHRHGQNVLGGEDGKGVFAMKCVNCHRDANTPGAHQPPGAPNWHLPEQRMPLVFEGKTAAQLAKQLADPAQNGGKSMDDVLRHVAEDALVGWGWAPGDGRAPVPVPRATFVAAMKAWIDAGCPIPQ